MNIGDTITVGQHFWTDEDKCIGFASDAAHGHSLDFGGSVGEGDKLEILGFEGDEAVVKVIKDNLPYGAPCPHGMIFLVDKAFLARQASLVEEQNKQGRWRSKMRQKYLSGGT